MARGDNIIDIISVTTGATTTFQPASGVEALLDHFGATQVTGTIPHILIAFYDGSLESHLFSNILNPELVQMPLKVKISNGHYLRLTNNHGSTSILSYSGTITKA